MADGTKKGARVVYRSQAGDDINGTIDSLSTDGLVAVLSLDNGQRVAGIERNAAGEGNRFLNSWTLLGHGRAIPDAEGLWTEALAAGIVTVLLDAADGAFELDKRGIQGALDSFKFGIGLVLAVEEKTDDGA
jgi:hypothetical protein